MPARAMPVSRPRKPAPPLRPPQLQHSDTVDAVSVRLRGEAFRALVRLADIQLPAHCARRQEAHM